MLLHSGPCDPTRLHAWYNSPYPHTPMVQQPILPPSPDPAMPAWIMCAAHAHSHGHGRSDELCVVARWDGVGKSLPRDLLDVIHLKAHRPAARALPESIQLLLALSGGVTRWEAGLRVPHHFAAPVDLARGHRCPRRVGDDCLP